MRLRLVTKPSEAEWRAVEQRAGPGMLSCSWDWTDTWLRSFGDVVEHRLLAADGPAGPLGFALVTRGNGRRRGGVPIRTVHLGTAGEPPEGGVFVEYNRLLVEPEARVPFAKAVVEAMRGEWAWDQLMLDGFTEEDATVLGQAEPRFVGDRVVCPVADLRPAREQGDAKVLLRKGPRQRLARSLRDFGPLETDWAETPDQANEIFDELIELHQARWTAAGEPGAFASPRVRSFHRELVSRLLPRGQILLFRVRRPEGTVGCLYSFIDGGRVLFYQGGLAHFDEARLKAGLVSHGLCIQACLERGLDEYDFLAGEARYKRELSNTERHLVWARAGRRSLRVITGDVTLAARGGVRRLAARRRD